MEFQIQGARRSLTFLIWVGFGLFLVSLGGLWLLDRGEKFTLVLAAGQRDAPSYRLATAIRDVAEAQYPALQVKVQETRDERQSATLFAQGRVDLAIADQDLILGNDVRLVAALYRDMFHLFVRSDVPARTISGLKNLRVAIPIEGTAGFDAFWFLAKHFGIEPGDIQMFSGTNSATQWLFEDGTVDAVFRVSPAGDPRLRSLVASQQARQIPIPQSDALALQWPSLQHVIIPQGAYQGLPAVPLTDTETVGIGRLLLAHSDAPTEAVFMLTSAIFENRRELIDRTPLAGFIAPPDQLAVYAPIHDGAREYFERDAPGFLQEYAEPLALFVSLIILIGTIVVHFSGRAARRRIERYNRKLLDLSHRARSADSFEQLDDCDTQLGQFVDHIILDFELGLISPNDFTVFQFTFTAAEDAIRDRASQLKRAAKGDLSAFLSSAANPLGVGSDVAFDLTKDFSDDTDAEGRR